MGTGGEDGFEGGGVGSGWRWGRRGRSGDEGGGSARWGHGHASVKGMAATPLLERQRSVEETVQCPICCVALRNARITPCGHNFCAECIDEWLSRSKRCPCCSATVQPDQLVSNRLVDYLLKVNVHLATCATPPDGARRALRS